MAFQQFPQKGGIPSGNTAGRPSGPVIGDTYYNGQLGLLEIYDGTNWVPASSPAAIPTISVTDVGTSRPYTSGAIAFTFTPGTNGGSPYGYTAIGTIASSSYTATTTSTTVSVAVGIAGSYSATGTAYNGFGTSPSNPALSVTVTTVPDAPTSVTVPSATTSAVTVSWTAPSATGGKTITEYTVTPYIGATAQTTTTTSSTSVSVSGLTQGQTYTFKVKASNANGYGLDSTASSAFIVPFAAEVLVVAGGGCGGSIIGGGGGAGGVRYTTSYDINSGSSLTVTVGAGSAIRNSSTYKGSPSQFGTLSATGGGSGQTSVDGADVNGAPGGSGGGAPWRDNATTRVGGAGNQGGYSPVEGYKGGDNLLTTSSATNVSGGGGGASAAGQDSQSGSQAGAGGAGVAYSITGSSVTYAGGGGGGARANSGAALGAGGAGGGGGSADGAPNTGGGGSGSAYTSNSNGWAGGSGIVILAYPSSYPALTSIGAGLTYTVSTSSRSGYRVYTFTQGTGTVTA